MLEATFDFLSHLHFIPSIAPLKKGSSIYQLKQSKYASKTLEGSLFHHIQKKGSTPKNATLHIHIIIKNMEKSLLVKLFKIIKNHFITRIVSFCLDL